MMAALGRNTQQQQPSAPGPGDSANSMQKLISAVTMIQQAAVGLPPGSPLWKDAMDAAKRLGRHLPQGAPTAGVQMTGIRDLLKQVMSSSFLPQIMQQLQGRGQQGGGQNAPAGAAPMPSMPLPGA